MVFEVIKYLESMGIDYVTSGPNVRKDNVAIHCVFCGDRDPSYHLGINYVRDFYYCWICGRSGNLVSLVKHIEGISWAEAREKITAPRIFGGGEVEKVEEIHARKANKVAEVTYELVEMPNDCIKIATGRESPGIAKFIRRRRLDMDTVLKYNLHYCSSGFYQGRVIIPIYNEYDDLISFGARAIHDDIKPKYFYPKGWPTSKYFFGANHIGNSDILILVEGIFDSMRLNGISVASFTHRLSVDQEAKLVNWRKLGLFNKLVIAFDGDSYNLSKQVARRLSAQIPDAVFCIELPYGEDPDSLGREEILKLCHN